MKFQVVAALMGLSQSIKLSESVRARGQEISRMHDICKSVNGIPYPHQNVLLQLDESPALPIAEKKAGVVEAPVETKSEETPAKKEVEPVEEKSEAAKNIKGSYQQHYGKTKAQVDAENKHILETQKTCLEFVKSHQGHPEVCEWCQKEYKRPEVVWKWNPEENTWYRYYDGGWHYWGPSKDGFTEGGWTWYNGHWHNDGYVFKYENGTWSRFQDHQWVPYGKEVPVDPQPPTGGKICRPFYKMMKQGFPHSLSSTQVPRCKVGDSIYMWTDDAACNFLGGVKAYQERVVCKSGEEHKWKRVVKCVQGATKLANGGFDYKTKQLKKELYPFKQCESYSNPATGKNYLYLFGEMKQFTEATAANLFKSPTKIIKLTEAQFNSAQHGVPLKAGSTLVSAQGGSYFLDSYKMEQFEDESVFAACQFDKSKVKPMSDADFATKQIGDIITV